MEQWINLQDYPGYSISDLGRVRNDDRDRMLTIVQKQNGYAYVGLTQNKIQVKRSVSRLVAEAFLPPSENKLFTTPIHFDGDLSNCRAINLDWRPRWFALKHTKQFKRTIFETTKEVLNLNTEEHFKDCWEAVFRYGLLYIDLIRAIANQTHVFPTMHKYKWWLQQK